MNSQQNSLSRTISYYTVSRGYRRILGFLLAFLRPKLLGPESFGLWTLLRLIPSYASYSQLGTHEALRYLIPYHRGRNEQLHVQKIEDTVFTFSLLSSLLVATIIIITALTLNIEAIVRWGLIAMAFVSFLLWLYEYFLFVLKAHEQFSLVTRSNYFEITAIFLITVPALYYFGIYGLFFSVPLSYLLTLLYMRFHFAFRLHFGFDYPLLLRLLKKGFPIMVMAFLIGLVSTSDRFLVSILLGVEQTGYYGMAALVIGFLMDAPGAAREVMEPRLMKSKDQLNTSEMAFHYIFNPMRSTAFLMPFLIGPVFFLTPCLVEFILPRFQESVEVTQVLCVGAFFFSLTNPLLAVIYSRDWQVRVLPCAILAIVVNIAGSIFLVSLGFGIMGVAISSVLSFAALVFSLFVFLHFKLQLITVMPVGFFWHLGLPLLLMVGLLYGLENIISSTGWMGVADRVTAAICYLLVMSGLFMIDKSSRENIGNSAEPQ